MNMPTRNHIRALAAETYRSMIEGRMPWNTPVNVMTLLYHMHEKQPSHNGTISVVELQVACNTATSFMGHFQFPYIGSELHVRFTPINVDDGTTSRGVSDLFATNNNPRPLSSQHPQHLQRGPDASIYRPTGGLHSQNGPGRFPPPPGF